MNENVVQTCALPERVEERLNIWKKAFKNARCVYFSIGILGASVSAIAATDILHSSQILSAVAAVCFAILGFAQPEQRYLKYVRAWRVLDIAACRYCHNLTSVADLFSSMEESEKMIGEFEAQARVPRDNMDSTAIRQMGQVPEQAPNT